MMEMAFCAALTAVAVALAGCASSQVPADQAAEAPTNRVFAPAKWLAPCADCGTLVVTRDAHTMTASGSSEKISLNGRKVAALWPAEKITLHLPAGRYVLSVTFGGLSGEDSAATVIVAGQRQVYRIGVGDFNDPKPRIMPAVN